MRTQAMNARNAFAWAGAALLAWSVQAQAQPQAWPTKPVHLVVSFAPGGSVDATARILSVALGERWKQPVIVENKAGADGNIAAEFVTRAAADGGTLLLTSNALVITPALRKLPFDPLKDLKPVVQVLSIPNLLVAHPTLPANSITELIALARAQPQKLSFASSGTGTTPFMGMALLMQVTGTRMTHVPFKGTAPAVMATVGNQTQLMFGDVNSTLPQVRGGKLKALGISSTQRSPLAPEIPTLAESGLPGFETSTWVGLLAPAGTPQAIVEAVQRDVIAVLSDPAIVARVRAMGGQVDARDSATFSATMRQDIERWTRIAREQDIKASD
jgi:tripartite-type tricarboxylate transporter receptor subunit TctC